MENKLLENSNTIEDVDSVGIKPLVITTRENAIAHTEAFLQGGTTSYFVSFNLDTSKNIKIGKDIKQYGVLKPTVQYMWMYHKIISAYDAIKRIADTGLIIFEQTKKGNIHFHMIYQSKVHMKYMESALASIFEIKKVKEQYNSINIVKITNTKGIIDYCFNKKEHDYECLDMKIFKPMIF